MQKRGSCASRTRLGACMRRCGILGPEPGMRLHVSSVFLGRANGVLLALLALVLTNAVGCDGDDPFRGTPRDGGAAGRPGMNGECAAGETSCDGACVSIQNDRQNCGG